MRTLRNITSFLAGFGFVVLVAFTSEAFAAYKISGFKWSYQNCKGSTHDYGNPELGKKSEWEAAGYFVTAYRGGLNEAQNCYEAYAKACPATNPYTDGTYDQYGQPNCYIEPQPTCGAGFEQQADGSCLNYPPPVCEAPNYIDQISGECITPEETCYTDLESMADECVLLGPGDPDLTDPIPEGCALDSSGNQLCLTEDPNCYTLNGIEACAKPDAVCGWKNGTFNCVTPEEEGCGYFNGERVCFTPDGQKVEESSPDHPDNGGNLDGNESNDPMDPRDPTTEGGDPSNQVDSPDTTDANRASEETARKQLSELFKLNTQLKNNTQAIKQGFESLTEQGDPSQIQATSEAIANTNIDGMQELEDGLGTNPLDETAANGVGNSVTSLVPQGTCSELGFNFNGHLFSLSCEKTQKIRDMLSWVLYFLTVWMLFDIVTAPVVRRA